MTKITPQGFNNIHFAMNPDEVMQTIGEPSSIDDDKHLGELAYYYHSLNLAIIFDPLTSCRTIESFECEGEDITLWDSLIMKTHYSDILKLIETQNITDIKEDHEQGVKYIFCQNMCFEFEQDALSSLTLYRPSE